jgi:hypothetical protein
MLFDPEQGVSIEISAGSFRSWIDFPDGDPNHAHIWVTVPVGELGVGFPRVRLRGHILLVTWAELDRFARDVRQLADRSVGSASLHEDALTITVGQDDTVGVEVVLRTGFDPHYELQYRGGRGTRADLADVADQLATAHANRGRTDPLASVPPAGSPEEVVRRYFRRIFEDRDPSACDELLAADFIDHEHPGIGPGATKTLLSAFLRTHPDVQIRIDRLVSLDRVVAVQATMHGSTYHRTGLLLIRVDEDGRIGESRSAYDA